jgi:hypothetical protein
MTLNLDQEASIIKDLKTLVAMIVFAIFASLGLILLYKAQNAIEKLKKMYAKVKQAMFWSVTIRSFDIAYL